MIFKSPTYGEKTKEQVLNFILEKVSSDPSYKIIIGTDSQNTYKTKMVIVVCVLKEGKGGNFFYHIDYLKKIKDLNTKIYTETELSLSLARELNQLLHEKGVRANVEIHVDIGRKGKTKDLIQSILGWVNSEGLECKIKPYSFVASTIADKISK